MESRPNQFEIVFSQPEIFHDVFFKLQFIHEKVY